MAKEPRPRPMAKTSPKTAAKPAVIKANRATMACGPVGTEKSVEIRKIDNGYIVRESSWSKGGKYSTRETFSPKPPTVQLAPGGKK